MSKKKAINFDLSEIADGSVQVKLDRAKYENIVRVKPSSVGACCSGRSCHIDSISSQR